jgi:hypothetical protein
MKSTRPEFALQWEDGYGRREGKNREVVSWEVQVGSGNGVDGFLVVGGRSGGKFGPTDGANRTDHI